MFILQGGKWRGRRKKKTHSMTILYNGHKASHLTLIWIGKGRERSSAYSRPPPGFPVCSGAHRGPCMLITIFWLNLLDVYVWLPFCHIWRLCCGWDHVGTGRLGWGRCTGTCVRASFRRLFPWVGLGKHRLKNIIFSTSDVVSLNVS